MIKVKVVSCVEQLKTYVACTEEKEDENLWEKLVVEPFWKELCCYSPIDLSDRKPKYIKRDANLKKQIAELEKIDLIVLEKELNRIAGLLPNYDDDLIMVAIFPIDNTNIIVNEKQNGVVGTSLFGNIMLQINPLVEGYENWINYVFAHEYHHTVWGNYWFNMHGDELKHDLLQALIIDGEADSFAMSVCKELRPQWLYLDKDEQIGKLYENKYEQHIFDTEFDYPSMMFGNEEKGICWCGGYAVGYRLVQKYIEKTNKSFTELIEVHPEKTL